MPKTRRYNKRSRCSKCGKIFSACGRTFDIALANLRKKLKSHKVLCKGGGKRPKKQRGW